MRNIVLDVDIQKYNRITIVVFTFICAALFSSLQTSQTSALDGNTFNPGYIISDSQFFDGYSLSDSAIQQWLSAQVPNCDKWGTQPYAGTTRAAYATSRGYPPPFTCLKDYSVTHGSVPADAYCGAISGGTKSAARLIMDVSRACNISPKVMLVLLQKEQGLVLDDWPWSMQYNSATGYYCLDSPLPASVDTNGNKCHDAYEGFFNQVYFGARQYQLYRVNQDDYNFRPGRTQHILFNPSTSCGSSPVYIQNQATAGLYNYTPYQPNAAALANLYGTGDGCSAYGNRNFWRMFSNWWGDPTAGCTNSPLNTQVLRLYDPKTFNHLYTLDYCEANNMKANYGYVLEGPAYNVSTDTANSVPIYRMYNPATKLHHYVTNQQEINEAIPGGYRYEGPVFSVYPSSYPGVYPVYRLYNPKTFIHMWVTTQAEITSATTKAGYIYEGPAFYTR